MSSLWFVEALRECYQAQSIEKEVTIHSYYTVTRKSVKRSAVDCVSAVRRLAQRSINHSTGYRGGAQLVGWLSQVSLIFRTANICRVSQRINKMLQLSSSFQIFAFFLLAVCCQSFQLSMKSGGHAQNFKFLPLLRGSRSFHFPRIVQIAGMYPDITAEELFAPPSTPGATGGLWAYDFPDPDRVDQGTVAIPGSPAMTDCIDPVAMITTNTALGVVLSEEVEMLVVVDRGDRYFTTESFYVFRTPQDSLVVQWADKVEPGFEVLGRVALCTVPYVPSMGTTSTGFAESDGEED